MRNNTTGLRFAVTVGDPAGVGPEVALKALALLPPARRRQLALIADRAALSRTAARFLRAVKLAPYDPHRLPPAGCAAFLEMSALPPKGVVAGTIDRAAGRAAAVYIAAGVELALKREVRGIITAPIHKKALALAGIPYPGHTEMLAALSGTKRYAMMLASPAMKVVVLTTHLSLRNAIKGVTEKAILEKLRLMHNTLRLKKPIGVCGLNPHASDGGLFGDEEARIIAPAIATARKAGINAVGPLPADTTFSPAIRDRYGALLAMYHDQGLVAIKAVSFGHCANITLGLPFIRTSVDHGTAFDIAGKGKADPSSMLFAIDSAFALAR